MNVLAFDTCLGAVSVAVRCGGIGTGRLYERFEQRQGGHAERLMPMIAEVMAEAGIGFPDLDRIGVTLGPGTFTGARVGVAAARALALASGLPVAGATSLEVMAHRARGLLGKGGDELLAVAVDARRGMTYFQLFGQDAGSPSLVTPEEAAASIRSRPVVVVGSGARSVVSVVSGASGRAEAQLADLQPHAASLAVLAEVLPTTPTLRPLYLRPPDVKPQEDKSLARVRLP